MSGVFFDYGDLLVGPTQPDSFEYRYLDDERSEFDLVNRSR